MKAALRRKPAVVSSDASLAIFCPKTSKMKGYPFEVPVSVKKICGDVLADQVKSLDWNIRTAKLIQKAEPDVLKDVFIRLNIIIDLADLGK